MKHTLVIGILLHAMTACLIADESGKFHRIKQLLEQMESLETERFRGQGDLHTTMDHFGHRSRPPEYPNFVEAVSTDWEAVWENFEEIAPTDIQQFILFSAIYSLPQKTSFLYMDKLADLALDKAINKEIFRSILSFYDDSTKGALACNHKNPIVASIFRKAKVLNPEELEYYKWVTSGSAYREVTSPFYYDHDTNDEPNLFSLKSWFIFLAQPIALVIYAVIAAIIIAIRKLVKRRRQRKE